MEITSTVCDEVYTFRKGVRWTTHQAIQRLKGFFSERKKEAFFVLQPKQTPGKDLKHAFKSSLSSFQKKKGLLKNRFLVFLATELECGNVVDFFT